MRLFICLVLPLLLSSCTTTPRIDSRVSEELKPISDALGAYWDYLYQRVDPKRPIENPKTRKRIEIHRKGIDKALSVMGETFAHPVNCLVLGGGYETDLTALLDRCTRVDVVDLSPRPLEVVDRTYKKNPKLKLIVADLSGIPIHYQSQALKNFSSVASTAPAQEILPALGEYYAKMPAQLEALPFESNAYAIVVSPLLIESLADGPLIPFLEARKQNKSEGQAIDQVVGTGFYLNNQVQGVFARLALHHSTELYRVLRPGGVAVLSAWKSDVGPSVSLGHHSLPRKDWNRLFQQWKKAEILGVFQPDGPKSPGRIVLKILRKPS